MDGLVEKTHDDAHGQNPLLAQLASGAGTLTKPAAARLHVQLPPHAVAGASAVIPSSVTQLVGKHPPVPQSHTLHSSAPGFSLQYTSCRSASRGSATWVGGVGRASSSRWTQCPAAAGKLAEQNSNNALALCHVCMLCTHVQLLLQLSGVNCM